MPRASRKMRGHVPQVARLARRDARFRVRDFIRQLGRFTGLVVTAAGLVGELLQEFAVLRGMEILRHAVFPSERHHVAPDLFLLPAGDDVGHVRAGLFGGPFPAVDALFERLRRQLDGGGSAVGPHEAGLHLGVGHRLVLLVAHLHPQRHLGFIGEHGLGRGGSHLAGRIGHQVAQNLLPESRLGLVVMGQPHFPAPASLGGEQHGAAAAVIFRHQQRRFALPRGGGYQQHRGAGLGIAGVLIVGHLRHLLPPLEVARGILIQPAEHALRRRRR